jgi:hypothetical protein
MELNSTVNPRLTYARFAGFMFLFNYVVNILGVLIPEWVRGSGDFADIAARIIESEWLYRFALTSWVIGWVSVVILAYALYVVLEPVDKRLAQIALYSRLGESFVGSVIVMLSFAILSLRLQGDGRSAGAFSNNQLQSLVSVMDSAVASGFHISMTFLGVGSTLFFFLFYRSRYIPRLLASLGVGSSVLMMMVSLGALIFPTYAGTFQYGWGPIGVAEITTAFWLLIVGIRPLQSNEA